MKTIPECTVAYVQTRLDSYECLFGKVPEMGALMEEAGCIPLAYYNDFWLQSPKITGSWHSANGYWFFMYADIAE